MSITRKVATVGAATLASRLLGFLRDAGIAAVLGAGVLSDAYFAALQVPNLFRRLLAEGALNSAYVPMSMRIRAKHGAWKASRFAGEVLGVTAVVLCAVAVGGILFAPALVHFLAPGFAGEGERFRLAVDFVRLSVPYVALSGVVAVAVAALNAEERVAAAAFGLVIFNCVLLGVVLALILSGAPATTRTGAILSGAIAVAGAAQLVCVGVAWWRLDTRPRRLSFSLSPDARKLLKRAIPGVVASGIPQLKLMAGTLVASASQAAVSWLYYANRLYELPLGVLSIAIAAVLVPAIAAALRSGDADQSAAAQSRALEIAIALSLPAAAAFAVLAEPIAAALFQRGAFGSRDTAMVAAALAAISAGLPGHALEKVLGAVSFAHEDTRTPMLTALCGLAAAAAGALVFFPHYGPVGIAAAIALSGWIGAALLALVLLRRRWLHIETAVWRHMTGIVLATVIMTATVAAGGALLDRLFGASGSLLGRAESLAVLVVAGLGVYVVALQAFGVASMRVLIEAFRA